MRDCIPSILILLAIALALLVADRFLRIRPFLEGFENGTQRCGVDMAPCPAGTVCANGFCIRQDPPTIPADTGLPVFPE